VSGDTRTRIVALANRSVALGSQQLQEMKSLVPAAEVEHAYTVYKQVEAVRLDVDKRAVAALEAGKRLGRAGPGAIRLAHKARALSNGLGVTNCQ
jgi:hypothetical protein